MNITETNVITVTGASWGFVRAALGAGEDANLAGFANVPSDQDWTALAASALTEAGLNPAVAPNAVLSATRPGFGAERHVEVRDGAVVAVIPDPMGGEWRVLLPDTIAWAQWISSGSGSSIAVEAEEGGTWTVTGSFPIWDGEVTEDWYFDCLREAIQQEPARAEARAKDSARLEEIRTKITEMFKDAALAALEGPEDGMDWHPWSLVDTNYLPESQEEFEENIEAIKAAGFVPEVRLAEVGGPLDWIAQYRPDGQIWTLGGVLPDTFAQDLRTEAAQICARWPELRPVEVIGFRPFAFAYPPQEAAAAA